MVNTERAIHHVIQEHLPIVAVINKEKGIRRYRIPISSAPPGSWVLIKGVDASSIMKTATEPLNLSELPKMVEGLRTISKELSSWDYQSKGRRSEATGLCFCLLLVHGNPTRVFLAKFRFEFASVFRPRFVYKARENHTNHVFFTQNCNVFTLVFSSSL